MSSAKKVTARALFGSLRHRSHGFRPGVNGLDDVMVARAAADIAFELFTDRLVVEVVALAAHDIDGGHDHAGRAEAALQTVMFAECRLHRMQLGAGGQALDGGDVRAVEAQRERGAGFHGASVDMNDATAALARVLSL